MLAKIYQDFVLERPRLFLVLLFVFLAVLGYQATNLEVDASAETLVLEDDKDLKIAREVGERYGSPDFLVITYSPADDLLADGTLETIRKLKADLEALAGVESVLTILDVPLMESPPMPVKELVKKVPTLETNGIDKTLAKKEFLNSPIYKDLLVSADFRTTAFQVNLVEDKTYIEFVNRRYKLREKQRENTLTGEEALELAQIQVDFKIYRDRIRAEQHEVIAQVRAVMDQYRGKAELFLGGVTMIADDLVTFIKNDLSVFGLGVLLFLIITLWVIFRQLRWILIPVLTCGLSVLATSGLLGLFGWEVTVISSNFISLQIIITMALTIHLVVRYREALGNHPDHTQKELVLEAVVAMFKPCAFMVLTTIAGFCSLLLSNILPVINFGWMMSAGIAVSLGLTFVIFPSVLVLMPKLPPNVTFESKFGLTKRFAQLTERHGGAILVSSAVLLVFCAVGVSKLMVENSFIDYFKESTEIYQGMKVIDQQLGGTTPLDVVLRFGDGKNGDQTAVAAKPKAPKATEAESEEFDEFEEEFEAQAGQAQYWFTSEKMAEIERVHDYLDSIPETGKVLSMGTMLKVGRNMNDGEPLDNFMLSLIYNELPEKYRKIVLNPYVSVEDNEARFSILVRDSEPSLRRNELLKKINRELNTELKLPPERFQVSGLLVLYNNMLQSLFNSQIMTIGAVVFALMTMFFILFRSAKIAIIAITPNILSVGVVLGLMGWAKIPLDLMTITIAAISVGIAVDDTIHYIHRFKEEFEKDFDYIGAMYRSHGSIGYAMYYTSITIIIGFSILVLSNFIPSIYFGLLTGLAMVIALISALTLLPQLIILLKPYGPQGGQ